MHVEPPLMRFLVRRISTSTLSVSPASTYNPPFRSLSLPRLCFSAFLRLLAHDFPVFCRRPTVDLPSTYRRSNVAVVVGTNSTTR